ncbi:hypothetical protein AGLY_006540 [Aphis glycines]|uniref:Uncharacterized protein n=1 Tax=Aphis glycines TaxID=307491 RepID=A0A6G0TRD2_APHGL|nr:hypothetical protein AGLY_006540 [Aphis glycines]
MHVKIAVILFAVTTLFQQSHCIPTHRYVRATSREGQDWTSRIKEYLNKIPGYGSQSPSSSTSQPDSSSYQQGANAGSESTSAGAAAGSAGAASEPQASIAAKEGSTSSSGIPSYTDYMPSQLSQYQNSFPNPSQFSQYQNQFPNPSQFTSYFPGSSGATAGSAGAASEPQASIAAKEGSTSSSGIPSYTDYMPSQLSQYQNSFPNPSQFSQYQNQFPNPSQFTSYFPGSSGATAGSAGAASEPQASIAAKEGSTSSSGFPSYTDYMPSQLSQYQNSFPNPSQFSQYQNQFPNPSQFTSYFPGSSGATAGSAGAASEPQASIAAKEGSTSSSGIPSYTDYMPSQLSQYQNSFPNPSQFSQYQNQFPNPSQFTSYFPGSSGATAGSAGAASEPQASIAAKEGSTSSSGFPSYTNYMPSQLSHYQNSFPNPSQFSQYQNQIPQSMNPGQYLSSKPTGA